MSSWPQLGKLVLMKLTALSFSAYCSGLELDGIAGDDMLKTVLYQTLSLIK